MSYRFELPEGSLVHPLFHVSPLKQQLPDHTPVFTILPEPPDLTVPGVILEETLERRPLKKGNYAHLQLLIRLATVPAASATWDDFEVLKARYPHAPAWGHAGSQGGGGASALFLSLKVRQPGKRKLKTEAASAET